VITDKATFTLCCSVYMNMESEVDANYCRMALIITVGDVVTDLQTVLHQLLVGYLLENSNANIHLCRLNASMSIVSFINLNIQRMPSTCRPFSRYALEFVCRDLLSILDPFKHICIACYTRIK